MPVTPEQLELDGKARRLRRAEFVESCCPLLFGAGAAGLLFYVLASAHSANLREWGEAVFFAGLFGGGLAEFVGRRMRPRR